MTISSRPSWVTQAVFYQIFPERFSNGDHTNDPVNSALWGTRPELNNFFGGDLKGILDHLPYLHDLGVDALYLTPIFKARTNHKYDASDYLEIDPAFGTLELVKELVKTAHSGGIRIVLDAVFNHCGDGFWAFEDLQKNGLASPYRDWFFPTTYPIQKKPASYQTCGGADFLPKLNTTNPQVREYLLKVARYWLEETGMDGWRLDVPWKVPVDFWQEFREVVKGVNPDAYIVAEAWRDPLPWVWGGTSDAVMNYPLRDTILDYCVFDHMDAEDFDYFTRRLLDQYGEAASYQLNLLDSHDTARILTTCSGDCRRMMLAIVASFTLPGAPMIYYGDENGMEGENDPDCRRCMNWQQSEWDQELRSLYRRLINLRHGHVALQTGTYETLLTLNGVAAYRRWQGDDEVVVVLNPREALRGVSVPMRGKVTACRDLVTGQILSVQNGLLMVETLPEKSFILLVPVQ
jgi:glycosidase